MAFLLGPVELMPVSAPKTTFIYCLTEPGSRIPRYFGKADNPKRRLREHLSDTQTYRHFRSARWIRRLQRDGKQPDMHLLCEVLLSDYERFERAFIFLGRKFGFDLTNLRPGGSGGVSGRLHTPEEIEKMKAALKGSKMSEAAKNKLRVPKSEETRLKFRTKKSTNTSGFVGVSKTARRRKWQASLCVKKKDYYLGTFRKIEDAVFVRALTIATQ